MIETRLLGVVPGLGPVQAFLLHNMNGGALEVMTLGASVTRLIAPDRNANHDDVVLGLDDVDAYWRSRSYFGATVGRYANRIANARFTLDGRVFTLNANDGANMLHGGADGFHRRNWRLADYDADGCEIAFALTSPDGDMGFPGTLEAQARYRLLPQGGFAIELTAACDAPCPVSLTNHAYFNLAGEGAGSIERHTLHIEADHYLPVRAGLIPTGEIAPIDNTPFDFRAPRVLGEALAAPHPQLALGGGFDHNFCLRAGEGLRLAAVVIDPLSGRRLRVRTTAPGLQFYSGAFLDGSEKRGQKRHSQRSGFCLEAQAYPDAPNTPHFPPTILRPGETWRAYTEYALDVAG